MRTDANWEVICNTLKRLVDITVKDFPTGRRNALHIRKEAYNLEVFREKKKNQQKKKKNPPPPPPPQKKKEKKETR